MISYNAPTWSYICPDDGDLGAIVAEMVRLVPSTSNLKGMIYGWTDPQTFKGVIDAQNRGVDCRIAYDSSQSSEPVENRNLGAFLSQAKTHDQKGEPYFYSCVSYDNNQIVHAKTLWVNWSTPPTSPYPLLNDWRDYVQQGYTVVLRGSYNFSSRAKQQVNTMDISPSWELAQMYEGTFDKLIQFNTPRQPTAAISHPQQGFIPDS